MEQEDHYIRCKFCGYQTMIDPALMRPEDPMQYCPECGEALSLTDDEDE